MILPILGKKKKEKSKIEENKLINFKPTQSIKEKENKALIITGNFKDVNGCIKGEEKYNIETKQCEKVKLDYRMYNFNKNIISEELNTMNDRQIDEILIDSELPINDKTKILKKDSVKKCGERIRIEDEIKKNNQEYDSLILEDNETISEQDEKEIPVTVVTKPINVPKIDIHGCSPNGNPPTFYCENSGKCENLNSYNFKNNLCKKEDEEKYKENYYFKIGILSIIVLIIIIGIVYFYQKIKY